MHILTCGETDSLAGQMSVMRGGPVKRRKKDDLDDSDEEEESDTDGEKNAQESETDTDTDTDEE